MKGGAGWNTLEQVQTWCNDHQHQCGNNPQYYIRNTQFFLKKSIDYDMLPPAEKVRLTNENRLQYVFGGPQAPQAGAGGRRRRRSTRRKSTRRRSTRRIRRR